MLTGGESFVDQTKESISPSSDIENDSPRTNNCIEGWHRAFDQRVGVNPLTPLSGDL